jgi:hypothetical protein
VVFGFLHGDGVGALDGVFNLTDYLLDQWEADFTAWACRAALFRPAGTAQMVGTSPPEIPAIAVSLDGGVHEYSRLFGRHVGLLGRAR